MLCKKVIETGTGNKDRSTKLRLRYSTGGTPNYKTFRATAREQLEIRSEAIQTKEPMNNIH